MSWRLLDFRIGRANRKQFWLIVALFSSINYLSGICFEKGYITEAAGIIIFLVTFYILGVVTVRRAHDLTFDYQDITGNDPEDLMYSAKMSNQCTPLIVPLLLFEAGDRIKNKYGYPPEGLKFMSMIAEDYSPSQKKEIEKAAQSHYKTDKYKKRRILENTEPFEVKGRKR